MPLSARSLFKLVFLPIIVCFFTLTKAGTPENTLIIWDLNGVLVKSDKSAMMSAFWNCSHKFDILKCVIPTVVQIFRSLSKHPSTFEEYIKICEPCNPHLAKLMRHMHGCQTLSPEMIDFVNELRSQGYTLGIATNMGRETLATLQSKYPEFFEKFSVFVTPDTVGPVGTFFKKPDIQYFHHMLEKYQQDKKQIIFIDDRAKNVHAAKQAGMQGIQFKSLAQLRDEFTKLTSCHKGSH